LRADQSRRFLRTLPCDAMKLRLWRLYSSLILIIMALIAQPTFAAPIKTAVKAIGHRGNQAKFEENVIAGLESGLEVADGIETYLSALL
jgi:glycerophosphoryl diester phosphodiesterase